MNKPTSRLLEENVERLVRHWADPVGEDQAELARLAFLERLHRDRRETLGPRSRFWGVVLVAASLAVAASVFWVVLRSRDSREGSLAWASPVPQDETENTIRRLISELGSADFSIQGSAAKALESLGPKALPALERAAKDESAQVREWAGKIRARIRAIDEAAKAERVELLAARLASDSPDDRDCAAAEISKMGRSAVPFLKKALEKALDADLRSRLEGLLWTLDLPSLFPARSGDRSSSVAHGGGTRETEGSVLAALQWLARHQNPDGGWSAEGFGLGCVNEKCGGPGERDYDTGVTGLALLAFLGAGYTTLSQDHYPDPARPGQILEFGQVVKSGLGWLAEHEDREGCVGQRGMKYLYNHAIATAALAEAWGMTREAFLERPAQRAVDFLVAAQNPAKGWRYSEKCGDNDTSVTGWSVMALKSAELSSLKVPGKAYADALAWLDDVTDRNGYFAVGYNARGTGKVFVPGKNDRFEHRPTMSAIGVVMRLWLDRRKNLPQMGAVNLLAADLPEWKEKGIDFYYWYYGTLALFQYDGPQGPLWKRWNEPLKNALVPNQRTKKDGCKDGSWDPELDRWGVAGGGRVYATAMNALTLEIYYRYPVVAK